MVCPWRHRSPPKQSGLARRFTASITSAVAVNPALQECDAGTILAQRDAKRGYSAWAIANIMSQNGYNDKEISDALGKAGVE